MPLNRIINDPDDVAAEALAGIVAAHPDLVITTPHARVFRAVQPVTNRVGIVTGGGSGHEPAFIGFVGPGLVDAVATGEVFASPTARAFEAAFKAADGGRGVACLYGNYAGDNMNVKMAVKLAERDGLTVKTVVANDDAASAPKDQIGKRRGVAGEVLMWKAGAALAAEGADLDAVIGVAQKAIDSTRSVGIGLSACTIPAAGKPNFTIEPGMMEVGIGHHGEPGVAVMPVKPAREMAALMLDTILPDLPFGRGEDVAVLLSGLGATPVMELYILYTHVAEILAAHGLTIRHRFVGNYFTSLEMMGASITLTRLDGELDRLIGKPARSIGLTVPGA
ncbi:dihydroxyacetone kinase subunit DhaK [Lichenifustis flavocetrariae]|uniref:Dihydroxyacetone kinase subunit DhaK n=1 Tax=Lichenifustis flavocetrariae TaxID=2949735 RepID=A0AA42CKC8_9HYPH|nr:dihydroxyacetone kinase subunit DhaK [Lichenifustis flavocetrariae]MCW6510443.1 dihydroxyacetone kinase subunit DhaK [Lichenifustis flavocetrariae]